MSILSKQDQKNKALNQLMLNLPSPISSCSICEYRMCPCRDEDITLDADGCWVKFNRMY